MRTPRALLFTPEYPPYLHGGLGTHVGELATGLEAAGWQVDVILAPLLGEAPSFVQAPPFSSIRVHVAQATHRSRMKDVVACAEQAMADRAPDVLHTHDMFFVPAAMSLRRAHRVPVVGTAHLLQEAIAPRLGDPTSPGRGAMEKLLCTGVDRLLVVSESMAEIAVQHYAADPQRVRMVHNGFAADEFSAPVTTGDDAELRASVASPGERIVLFAGRIARQKGVEALLEVAALVGTSRHDVRFVIAGEALDPDYREAWENAWARRAPEARVTRAGKLTRATLARLYRVSEVAVVPSLYEPFGYAALEAMASGVPLVTSAVGGLPEIVQHERTGLCVPTLCGEGGPDRIDVPSFGAAVLRLLDDRDAALRMAAAARDRARTFSVERMTDATIRVYREAIDASVRA